MKALVVSHKECWRSSSGSDGQWQTDGGFPRQIGALAHLFDSMVLAVPEVAARRHGGSRLPASVDVVPLPRLPGRRWRRKLLFPFWLLRALPVLLRLTRSADCVHALVPGDVGAAGWLLAMACGKPVLVRHCGRWGRPASLVDRCLQSGMAWLAGPRRLMLATGHGSRDPVEGRRHLRWIFATSLTERDVAELARPRHLDPTGPPRLVIACRQAAGKGTERVLAALPLVRERFPGARLEIVGDGPLLGRHRRRVRQAGLEGAVRFHGAVPRADVLEVLGRCDLLCYPTTAAEGFPKVVVEAMASGLPCVVSDLPVLEHLVGEGAGRVVASLEPGPLAAAVVECLEDPVRYAQMSRQALETARRYTLERWRQEIGDFVRSAWGELGKPTFVAEDLSA